MKNTLKYSPSFVFFTVLLLLGSLCKQKPSEKKESSKSTLPNILFLMADDAGWKDFGCYGHPSLKTPNIDNLASTGLQFNNAFLTTSSCSPSRTSILSGKYAHSIGTEDMHVPLPDSVKLLPSFLKQEGYFTGHMLKTHYGPEGEKQFDWYSNKLEDFTQFLDSADESPFFMWIGFKDPHRPYKTSEYAKPFPPGEVVVPPYLSDTPETRQDLADYYSEIIRLDEHVGWIVKELEKRNLRENTVIIFLSDNGAPFPAAKGTLYDTGIGTPLIFNWPEKLPHGHHYDGIVSTIDLAPTVLEIANIEHPANMPGRSLLPLLNGEKNYERKYAFSERNWHGADEHMRSVRTLDYKFITNSFQDLPFGSPSDIVESDSWQALYDEKESHRLTVAQQRLFQYPRPGRELYDLKADPGEIKNLADNPEYAGIVREMDDVLADWQRSTNDVSPDENRKEDKTNRFTGEKTIALNEQ
jgi:N-sulfoglucosamine sulfohydrolase